VGSRPACAIDGDGCAVGVGILQVSPLYLKFGDGLLKRASIFIQMEMRDFGSTAGHAVWVALRSSAVRVCFLFWLGGFTGSPWAKGDRGRRSAARRPAVQLLQLWRSTLAQLDPDDRSLSVVCCAATALI